MQVRYEKDNKERIPFEHYLEEFAAIDPKEAAARVGVPWHDAESISCKMAGMYHSKGKSI